MAGVKLTWRHDTSRQRHYFEGKLAGHGLVYGHVDKPTEERDSYLAVVPFVHARKECGSLREAKAFVEKHVRNKLSENNTGG